MYRKGVSPLIAMVMLIAFAISIGGLFAEWSGSLTRDATQENTNQQQKILDCSRMQIEFVEVEEDYANNDLNVTLRSDNGAVGNVTVTAFPSVTSGFVNLSSAGEIGSVSLSVSSQQDSVRASSQECSIRVDKELNN